MKVRTGFVSNSSSSSYLVIIPKEKRAEVESKMDPVALAVIERIGWQEIENFMGQELLKMEWVTGNYAWPEIYSDNMFDRIKELCEERKVNLYKLVGLREECFDTEEPDEDAMEDLMDAIDDELGDTICGLEKEIYEAAGEGYCIVHTSDF